jgi:flavin reductase (DIM6/NTAB) family NADH-FMN oxidoreductase RutF
MSKNEKQTTLTLDQMNYINSNPLILLSTIEQETNFPNTSAVSWVKCLDPKKLRFSVTKNSRIITNIRSNPNVTITFLGLGTVHSILGKATILEEKIPNINIPLAKVEIDIVAVFDSMFWGAKLTQDPYFEKTYDFDKANTLDSQVYEALLT